MREDTNSAGNASKCALDVLGLLNRQPRKIRFAVAPDFGDIESDFGQHGPARSTARWVISTHGIAFPIR
jgi:hypothetical protein